MADTKPLVSVVMPVFNAHKYLKTAIESILAQSYPHVELLIVEDGSTDGSKEIIEKIEDPRIQVFYPQKKLGNTLARNYGWEKSNGDYVALMDADDWSAPDRLEKQVAFLEANKSFAMIGTWVRLMDENDDLTDKSWRPPTRSKAIAARMLFNNCFVQSVVMVRKSFFPDPPYDEQYPLTADFELWSRIAAEYPVANLPEYLVHYRVHSTSITATRSAEIKRWVSETYLRQFQRWGISVSEEEVAIHWAICQGNGKIDFSDGFKWLRKLLKENRNSKRYERRSFLLLILRNLGKLMLRR